MAVRRPGCGHGGWPDALPALEVPGVRAAFEEGDEAEVDFDAATVTNLRSGTRLVGAPWPDMLMKSLRAGGLIERLEAEGLVHPAGWRPGNG
jgi:3-isopropylmalate/(R)-2-methylmalate dehydratase small subunit